ncbi:MAG: hypothetical protein J6I84_03470 [Bacilli bacterium]|nr:hypothetical protein [Bacilli bacterium]
MIIAPKIIVGEEKILSVLQARGYTSSSLINILKKEFKITKNGKDFNTEFGTYGKFVYTKLVWENETEYRELCITISRLLNLLKGNHLPDYNRGSGLISLVPGDNGNYNYGYGCWRNKNCLRYYTIETTFERLIRKDYMIE